MEAVMFLGSYYFPGDPAALIQAYERFMAGYPEDSLLLHVCVVGKDGITVYDTCPDRQVFDAFSTSAEFTSAVAAVGLPQPVITPCGDVYSAKAGDVISATAGEAGPA